MRIVSLLPSTTEIVCALGGESNLVGRSHECDYPESVQSLPACTSPKYQTDGTSYETDQKVKAIVQEGLSVYRVDTDLLNSLEPDLILTQDHCEVCAASYDDVRKAVEEHLGRDIRVVSVSAADLDGALLSIQQIAEAMDAGEAATELITRMSRGFNSLQKQTRNLPAPRVACIEWIDPPMSAGNWFPELVEVAGGESILATPGEPSPWIDWEVLVEQDPDLLLISPCGYSIDKTEREMPVLTDREGWDRLQAIQQKRVFLMEGDHYFHRPGPRLIEAAEILAEIFHPGIFDPQHRPGGWISYYGE